MKHLAFLVAATFLGGCLASEKDAPPAEGMADPPLELAAEPKPVFPLRYRGNYSVELMVGACVHDDVCPTTVVQESRPVFTPKPNQTVAAQSANMTWVLTATWTPSTSTATELHITLREKGTFEVVARAVGRSPLVLELEDDAVPITADYVPSIGPNGAGVLRNQVVELVLEAR